MGEEGNIHINGHLHSQWKRLWKRKYNLDHVDSSRGRSIFQIVTPQPVNPSIIYNYVKMCPPPLKNSKLDKKCGPLKYFDGASCGLRYETPFWAPLSSKVFSVYNLDSKCFTIESYLSLTTYRKVKVSNKSPFLQGNWNEKVVNKEMF